MNAELALLVIEFHSILENKLGELIAAIINSANLFPLLKLSLGFPALFPHSFFINSISFNTGN